MILPMRKKMRLDCWDYNESAWYFVTICTAGRKPILGTMRFESDEVKVELSEIGKLCLNSLVCAQNVSHIQVDSYVIMPNHIHLLVCIDEKEGSLYRASNHLSRFVASFKGKVTKEAREIEPGISVWQRGFDERIIRDVGHLDNVRNYIRNNPIKWAVDKYHLAY